MATDANLHVDPRPPRFARRAALLVWALVVFAGVSPAQAARASVSAPSRLTAFPAAAGAEMPAGPGLGDLPKKPAGSLIALPLPAPGYGALVAHVIRPTGARSGPGTGRILWRVPTSTIFAHQAQNLMVLGARYGRRNVPWLLVALPTRPNHSVGWIDADYAVLVRSPYYVQVSVLARSVTVLQEGHVVRRMSAVVGKPATPTPGGLFALYETVRQGDPRGFVGPWTLQLTAYSNVLDHFEDGPGRVAIHGRDGSSFIDPLGSARSHGCVRVADSEIEWLARHIPQGTPVQIQ